MSSDSRTGPTRPGFAGGLVTALLTGGVRGLPRGVARAAAALAGAVAHDLVPGTLRRLRLTALVGAGIVVLLALPAARVDVGALVTSAFAVTASTFCPLLVLVIRWSRLTARGALVGMAVGQLASAGVMGPAPVAGLEPGLPALLPAQPAIGRCRWRSRR